MESDTGKLHRDTVSMSLQSHCPAALKSLCPSWTNTTAVKKRRKKNAVKLLWKN